jgi:Protein of unknown function (DUF4232)
VDARTVVLGLGLVVLVTGCSSSSSGGAVTQPTASSPVATVTPTPVRSHTHRPSVTPTPTPTPTPTVTVTAPVAGRPCRSSHLRLSNGIGQGTAGTSYTVIVLTNTGTVSCTLFGYPGVSFVDSNGATVGLPASRDPGHVRTITLPVGGAANALLRSPDPDAFAPSACKPATTRRMRVYPPGETVPLFIRSRGQVCTTAKGRNGIGPMLAGNGG